VKLLRLTEPERRWAHAAFGAIFPAVPELDMPSIVSLGLDAFLDDFAASTPAKTMLGVRVGVAMVALSPPFVLARFCTIAGLSDAERDELVARLAASGFNPARQLLLVLKATGALLYGAAPEVRARLLAQQPLVGLTRKPQRAA
jgi:hypothetical protein